MESKWNCTLPHQGGAALQQWVHKINDLDNGLQPPPSILHTAAHKFTPRDADTATLKAMVERGKLPSTLQRLAPGQPRALGIGDKVELLLEMPTEIEGETKDEWIDRRATILSRSKVTDSSYTPRAVKA